MSKNKNRLQMQHKNDQPLNESERDELARLRRENERLKEWESIYAGGIRQGVDAKWERLQVERDELKAKLDDLNAVLDSSELAIIQKLLFLRDEADSEFVKFDNEIDNKINNPLPRWIVDSVMSFDNLFIEAQAEREKEYASLYEKDHPMIRLMRLQNSAVAVGYKELMWNLIRLARVYSDNPYWVCKVIIENLKRTGQADIHLVSALKIEWIQEHISDLIGSHKVFCEAINHHWQYRISGLTGEVYVNREHISLPQLRRYSQYFKQLESFAGNAPDDISLLLEGKAE